MTESEVKLIKLIRESLLSDAHFAFCDYFQTLRNVFYGWITARRNVITLLVVSSAIATLDLP